MKLYQLPILVAPGICASAIGVGPADLSRLVRVIYPRRAGPCHLYQHGKLHRPLVNAVLRRMRPLRAYRANGAVCSRQKPRMVVVGKLVQRRIQRRPREFGHAFEHTVEKLIAIVKLSAVKALAVLVNARQQPRHRLHKRVVIHYRIPLAAFEPALGRAVMLCKHKRLGIALAHSVVELLPEFMIVFFAVPQIRGNVQTPPVHIIRLGNPFAARLHNIFHKLRAVLVIQLRQGGIAPPALVLAFCLGGLFKAEIASVRAFYRLVRAVFIALFIQINALAVKPLVERPAMIKHAVYNNAHSAGMNFLNNLCKIRVACFKIFARGHALYIFGRITVVLFPVLHAVVAVLLYHR